MNIATETTLLILLFTHMCLSYKTDLHQNTPALRNDDKHLAPRSIAHSRRRRQIFDGLDFSNIRSTIGNWIGKRTLENVDNVLRSTRDFDIFRCLERVSCEILAPIPTNRVSQAPVQQFPQAAQHTAQPVQYAQPPHYAQPVQQYIQPLHQFPPPSQHIAPQHAAHPAQNYQQYYVPQHYQQPVGYVPEYYRNRDSQRRTDIVPVTESSYLSYEIPHHTEPHEEKSVRVERKGRAWLKRIFGRKKRDVSQQQFKLRRRAKRGLFDAFKGFSGKGFVNVLDRMMEGTDDSLYPYTRAALLGYTGSSDTCKTTYPECPTNMNEVIDTFNNLRSHFPQGVPFKEKLPFPLNVILP